MAVGLTVDDMLSLALVRCAAPSLSLLSEVEQKTESWARGVIAPLDLDSLSPLGARSEAPRIGVALVVVG